jgi:hypothetical protein
MSNVVFADEDNVAFVTRGPLNGGDSANTVNSAQQKAKQILTQ